MPADPSSSPALRAAGADRDRVIELLHAAVADGRFESAACHCLTSDDAGHADPGRGSGRRPRKAGHCPVSGLKAAPLRGTAGVPATGLCVEEARPSRARRNRPDLAARARDSTAE